MPPPHAFAPGDLVLARGREWVALPPPRPGLLSLRPLSGSEADAILLDPRLEPDPPVPARFTLPPDAAHAVQATASLLADALRLGLRRGAGPFRAAAQITVEPRAYQLVPLLMALRQPVPRLLIADDVGIGKTIEAGLILRELIDRGTLDAFAVLCPPHLVEQWMAELADRFGIRATAVTAASAPRLERGLPAAQTIFDAHAFTVVSLDYIKAERRRDSFARACPKMVVVDEAHACVGTHQGRQQRFDLLQGLARDPARALILLTATPHSGDEMAFARLLSLIDPAFGSLNFADQRFRERLARHYVQRRRSDLVSGDWAEDRAFPRHLTTDREYHLTPAHQAFHDAVLDWCLGVVTRAGAADRSRRLAFWGTLALMRCVGSSPAAAYGALRTRAATDADRIEAQVYVDDGEDEDAVDLTPAAPLDGDLGDLIGMAQALQSAPDPKVAALMALLKPALSEGHNPVVFCRYLATADQLAEALRRAFPKLRIEAVTGRLTPDDRRARVSDMGNADQRILVATDCLSEGINLQTLFDMVVHDDLSRNPTRHQQREGRVNRFGQPSPEVRSVLMVSPDSAIDGAVLEVILRKAEAIRAATGVTVPLPEDRGPVTDALMNAVLLRRPATRQMAFDLRLADATTAVEARWRDAQDNERRSRAIFAQNAMKPQEVAPEWARARDLLGDAAAAQGFVSAAMARFGAPLLTTKSGAVALVGNLPSALRDRLHAAGLPDRLPVSFAEPAAPGTTRLTRSHPLTATLAEALLEGALDPAAMPGLSMGRTGVWPTAAVTVRTTLVLTRLRLKITLGARADRVLLAEEADLVAIAGDRIIATGAAARALLAAPATGNLADIARDRMLATARAGLPGWLDGQLAAHAAERAEILRSDHERVRAATGSAARDTVTAILPPDVIGMFVLLPAGPA